MRPMAPAPPTSSVVHQAYFVKALIPRAVRSGVPVFRFLPSPHFPSRNCCYSRPSFIARNCEFSMKAYFTAVRWPLLFGLILLLAGCAKKKIKNLWLFRAFPNLIIIWTPRNAVLSSSGYAWVARVAVAYLAPTNTLTPKRNPIPLLAPPPPTLLQPRPKVHHAIQRAAIQYLGLFADTF